MQSLCHRTISCRTKAGGDPYGQNLRPASYTPNNLNQYTSRTVPGGFDMVGVANKDATVRVDGNDVQYRRGEYWRQYVSVDNEGVPVWRSVSVTTTGGGTTTGSVFVPKALEEFVFDLNGNLTSDGRWTYVWDGENRLTQMTANTTVGPQYQIDFEYDWKGRRIRKMVTDLSDSTVILDSKFLYNGWNLIAELDANNALVRSYVWGLDVSGSFQGAGGVCGLLMVKDAANGTHFVAYDLNGNVMGLVNAANGTISAQYEYGPFGEVIRATGPMAKANPFRFATQYSDDESDIVWYPRRPYNPSTGRWLSRDPIEEEGGENLYIFCGNDSLNHWDLLGEKWKVDRNGGGKASAVPEKGDTVADLASMIGLNASEYQRWLTADSGTAMPSSSGQAMGGCEHFEVPNTVVAYWAGNLGWAGRWYVRWNSSVKYLGSLGFKVENHHHQKGDTWGLMKIFMPESMGKELHGVYFWGHGSAPYPAQYLVSDSGDALLEFSQPGLYYHMGLGLVFACDSNSGQSALVSGNGIWKGFTGTLVPWPFKAYHAKHYIHHGDQATH